MLDPRRLRPPAPARTAATPAAAGLVAVRAPAPSRSDWAGCMPMRECAAGARAPGHRRSRRRRAADPFRGWRLVLAVNGEITTTTANSGAPAGQAVCVPDRLDCEVISALYRDGEAPGDLDPAAQRASSRSPCGMRRRSGRWSRDHMGICPLYWGHDADGRPWYQVASEMKALVRICDDVAAFPPARVYDSATGELVTITSAPGATTTPCRASPPTRPNCARRSSRGAPPADERRAPWRAAVGRAGFVAGRGLRRKFARKRVEDDDQTEAWWPRLHQFAIGLDGSPTSPPPRSPQTGLGTVHHGFTTASPKALDALPE